MKVIGIVGSRRRNSKADFNSTEKCFLDIYANGDEIVSGGCPKGADAMAEHFAKKHQVPIKIYYAEWNHLGRGAGFARNTYIARDADILIACVAEDRTGGTEDTVKKFCQKNSKDEQSLIEEKRLILVPFESEEDWLQI